MELKDKLAILEDMMELEAGSLAPETSLEDLEEWDSLTSVTHFSLGAFAVKSRPMLNVMERDD